MLRPYFITWMAGFAVVLWICGCDSPQRTPDAAVDFGNIEQLQVGDLVETPELQPSPVEGYGLVAGLAGNGSAECPVEILEYLRRFAQIHLRESGVRPETLIRDMDTAVVRITGEIPPGLRKGQRFDLSIQPVYGTQTRSLVGGRLYSSELVPMGRALASAIPVATARGAVFINKLDGPPDELNGYVLGGGIASADYLPALVLRQPDFRDAAAIRNRINQRFGEVVAIARNQEIIELDVPRSYRGREREMLKIIRGLYIVENDQLRAQRIADLVEQLQQPAARDRAEAALMAMGRPVADSVRPFLAASEPHMRFIAARVMMSFGDRDAVNVLRTIAYDPDSPYRLEAIDAIAIWADSRQKNSLLTGLLDDPDMDIRMAAYEELVKIDSPAIHREVVGGRFFFDEVICGGPPAIYVSRSGAPKIVVFGFGQTLQGDVFLETAGGAVILNSPEGSETVSVIRGRRNEFDIIARPLPSTRLLHDVVLTLSSTPETVGNRIRLNGLGVPYSDTAEVLKKLCEKGFLDARFVAGPLPKLGLD